MADAVEAVNYFQEIVRRAGTGTMADAVLEGMGWHPKQADAILLRAAKEGYIDYGVSARTGWLTDKGNALLASLDTGPSVAELA